MAIFSENERINLINPYLRDKFGEKTVKLALDGGFTCPNRDGTKGFGGCSFCSSRGSGDNASNIEDQIKLLSTKWPNVSSYISYFQNYTSTYAPVEKLRSLFYEAINLTFINGLAIATRPDCLPDDVLDLLSELNERTFLWIELGLQTANDRIAASFGRGYETDVYYKAMKELNKRNIKVVTHLMLGLPNENYYDMEASMETAIKAKSWGLKFHLLNIIKGTRMEEEYGNYSYFTSPNHYSNTVCDLLEKCPHEIIIHRLSADSPKETLVAPKWAYRKRPLIDMIKKEMIERDSYQGSKR